MLRRIYLELVLIRKGLQAIQDNLELEQKLSDNAQKEIENHMSLVKKMIENTIHHTRNNNQFESELSLSIESKRVTEIFKVFPFEVESDDKFSRAV